MFSNRPHLLWLILYVSINIAASFVIYDTGELIGDVAGSSLYSVDALILATMLVVCSYFLILGPFFDLISRIKIKPALCGGGEDQYGTRLGLLIIFFQIGFTIFNLTTGVNIAGQNNAKTDSIFAPLWVLIPTDALFLIYYGLYRKNKLFYPNLCLYLISNILRGWASVFMLILFAELSLAFRARKISPLFLLLCATLVLLIYPLISNLKWIMRASAGVELTLWDLFNGFEVFLNSASYGELLFSGMLHLISRIQSVSLVVETIRMSDILQATYNNGLILPFWKEGLLGAIFDRAFGVEKVWPIGVAFTELYFHGGISEVGDWNTSLGYVSWFFIAPYYSLIYVLYTLLLMIISVILIKKIGATSLAKDILWFCCLVYLMAPWPGVFVGYVYALLFFLLLKKLIHIKWL
jgi:hypothetical protein